QRDADVDVVVVDNASTDGTGGLVRAYAARWDLRRWRVVDEPQKGTGAAADTGIRAASGAGATHVARTGADCVPDAGWTAALRRAFEDGLEMVTGPMLPRTDGVAGGPWRRTALRGAVALASTFGRVRPGN